MLKQWGIEAERVQLVWASASEGNLLAAAVDRMTEELRALGPLQWRESVLGGNGHQPLEVAEVEAQVEEV
jgi:F420-non-reducing hydrogenase iron-sulfur subunit